tara:strand:- start:3943 stop:4431 length:489 start_codon:yes stop_codon:yes gene_type:complete
MYLSKSRILKRITQDNLIENSDNSNIQGAGVDLTIDNLFEIISSSNLNINSRELPQLNELHLSQYCLNPGSYYLCTTTEKVNMPDDLVAFILPRSTLFRCAVSLRTAVIDPGYSGILTIGIKNEGTYPFNIEKGSCFCQIVFSEVRGKTPSYDGKYQGGKIK